MATNKPPILPFRGVERAAGIEPHAVRLANLVQPQEMPFDNITGKHFDSGDYLLPGATEVPAARIAHMESPSPYTAIGQTGRGEGGAIAPRAAIVNAINAALGAEITDCPMVRALIEALQHKTAKRLKNAIAINLVMAWRIMLMTLLDRQCPDRPAKVLFSKLDAEVLPAYEKKPRQPDLLASNC